MLAALLPATLLAAAAVDDPWSWLEDWTGKRSMDWVEAENTRTLARLTQDPRYPGFYRDALAIASSQDRIPSPELINGRVFNLWRDGAHPQGIWRYTSEADYGAAEPRWTTLLDLDALSKAEGKKWVWKGVTCHAPEERLCLLHLSDGGEDATTVREFDLATGRFVADGFLLPTSKQDVAWLDRDTLLVARDWGAGTMTASGYPFVVRKLRRGQPLAAAEEVFRGIPQDVGVSPYVLTDGTGNRAAFINRATTFFTSETYLLGPAGAKRVPLPAKCEVKGMVAGQVLVQVSENWQAGGLQVPSGAVAGVALAAMAAGEALHPALLFAPNPRQSVGGVAVTRTRALLTINDNVRGRALVFTPGTAGWTSTQLALPDNAAIDVEAATDRSELAYLTVTGFLQPTTLWSLEATTPSPRQVKALPAQFNAAGLVVEQFEAISTDGTKVPYFIVHRQDIRLDGSTPAIMTAYGGFEVSNTPVYSGLNGKLWMERGGSFVLANIRGGGEFGPAWHQAGLKTKRQVIYDDFAAVARDIFARKLSSPRRFGIYGGSNGGLLMGVEFNQHPELWQAVVIQVPLLDMLRYEQIAAGASWVDEYGSVSVPEERAFLAKISPYHNVRQGAAYPEPYIWTTTKDDRVGPQHARKFAARLKELGLPYLFYEDTAGGHSGDADIEQGARLRALQMVYFAQKLEGDAAR
jgi:prolyl oligopeptidase